jgi:hypothetical protein
LLDAGREQVYHLGDAPGAQLWPLGGGIDPAEIGLAVELRQRVEERRSGGVGFQRGGDVVSQIAALRAFRGQLDDYVVAGRDACIAHPHRRQGERPSAAVRRDLPADQSAVDRPGHQMLRFGTPRLVRVKRDRDHRPARRTSSNASTEPLNAHDLYRGPAGPWWGGFSNTGSGTTEQNGDKPGLARNYPTHGGFGHGASAYGHQKLSPDCK